MPARALFRIHSKALRASLYQPGAVARAGTALSFSLVGVALFHAATSAQDRLKTMPSTSQYQKVSTAERRRAFGRRQWNLECRQRRCRVRARWQAVSLRRRHSQRTTSLVRRRTLAVAADAVVDAEAPASNAAGRPPADAPTAS